MDAYTLHRGWRADHDVILTALRQCYSYTEGSPDRASDWLYSDHDGPVVRKQEWPASLTILGPQLLDDLEELLGLRFQAVAFQAYLDGSGVDWHYDRDWDVQAILSLGVTRTFGLRRDGEETFFPLHHGDLILMPSGFQEDWYHSVPTEDAPGERCSMVFRIAVTHAQREERAQRRA